MKKITILFIMLSGFSLMNAQLPNTSRVYKKFQSALDLKVVLFEDFSKCQAGSEDTPDKSEISVYEDGLIPLQYINTIGWKGAGIFQAGGCCYIDIADFIDENGNNYKATGFLDTPYLDLQDYEGKFTLTFRAKSAQSRDSLNIYSTVFLKSSYELKEVELSNQWKEFTFEFDNGDVDGYIRFIADDFPCFIDDVKIVQGEAALMLPAPEVRPASDVQDSKFTANWKAVEGATSYLLNVYSYNGTERDYFLEDEEISTTYCVVESLVGGVQYYYTVKAKNASTVSEESVEMKVEKSGIQAAVLLEPTNVTENSFTANWEAVDGVSGYWFYLFETYKAKKDEIITVIDEDFSKVNKGTLNNPVYGSMQEILDPYTKDSGWEAIFPLYAEGMIGVSTDNFISMIISPRFDFSANDGKFKVELNAIAGIGDKLFVTKECTEASLMEPAEMETFDFDAKNSKFEVEFTHHNQYSVGGIDLLFESTGKKTFIDDIKITKALRAGDSLSYIHFAEIRPKSGLVQSVDVEVDPRPGCSYSYGIVVLKPIDEDPGLDFLGYENRMSVPIYGSSIKSDYNDNVSAYISGENLYVILGMEAPVEIYTLTGNRIIYAKGLIGENLFALPEKGIYIVKAGNSVVKVIK